MYPQVGSKWVAKEPYGGDSNVFVVEVVSLFTFSNPETKQQEPTVAVHSNRYGRDFGKSYDLDTFREYYKPYYGE